MYYFLKFICEAIIIIYIGFVFIDYIDYKNHYEERVEKRLIEEREKMLERRKANNEDSRKEK